MPRRRSPVTSLAIQDRLGQPAGDAGEEATMRMRLGAPLVLAAAGLFWAAAPAQAAHCGCTLFQPKSTCCDAQSCFNSAQQGTRTSYKLVWDPVTEKRFHVCHQTVGETVMKPVGKTCYRTEQRTGTRQEQVVEYRTEQRAVTRPVYQTVMKPVTYATYRPVYEAQQRT